MDEVLKAERETKEEAFFSKPCYFSYSSLNKLVEAPNIFYKEYVLKEKEIQTEKYLLEGQLIHFLILENQNFDDKFMVVPETLPSPNSMKVAEIIYKDFYLPKVEEDAKNESLALADFIVEVDDVLKEIGLHQNVKNKEKRVGKIIEPRTEVYFDFLKVKDRKIIIDSATLDKCTYAADIVKTNSEIRDLLGLDRKSDGRTFAAYNELDLKMKLDDKVGLRGILDNMTVDVQEKLIRINDFKTTGKSIVDFPDSVEYWRYWMQAAIYLKLAMNYLKKVIDDSWTFEIRFIVYDRHNQVYPFSVSNESLLKWIKDTDAIIEDSRYHIENRDFSLPYQFIAGEVSL